MSAVRGGADWLCSARAFPGMTRSSHGANRRAAWQNCARCRHLRPHRRLRPRRNPHRSGTTAVPNPRFRALALFGRRPSECVDKPSFRRPKTCTLPDSCTVASASSRIRYAVDLAGFSFVRVVLSSFGWAFSWEINKHFSPSAVIPFRAFGWRFRRAPRRGAGSWHRGSSARRAANAR